MGDAKYLSHVERQARRKSIAADCRTMDFHDVCRKYDVSEGLVLRACREYRVDCTRKFRPPARAFVILAGLLRGKSLREVAEALGVTSQRVSHVKALALKAGIVLPTRSGNG